MNKKLLVLLLIAVLTAFTFVSCVPTPPNEGEGEGEGELELGIVVEGAYENDGKTYVKAGKSYNVVVTFPTKTENVMAYYNCVGDLAKGPFGSEPDGVGLLTPNADGTVWSGSMSFTKTDDNGSCGVTDCLVGYVWVKWGLCEDCYYGMPIVVDGDLPYGAFKVTTKCCDCEGCKLTFESIEEEFSCSEVACCGDDCSGLAGWSIDIYKKAPFDECCSMDCAKPICPTISGTGCPVEKTSLDCCLEPAEAGTNYWVVATPEDNVGNRSMFGLTFTLTDTCAETEGGCAITDFDVYCVDCPDFYGVDTGSDPFTFGICPDKNGVVHWDSYECE